MQRYSMCSFPGCERPHVAKGFCHAHHRQSRKGQPLYPVHSTQRKAGTAPRVICDEVMCLVPGLIGPCHVVRGGKNKAGYGTVRMQGSNMTLVHRYIWEKENGDIPEGMMVDHRCRNRACCNVDHLRVVTPKINATENVVGSAPQLMAAKTHCPKGHPYDTENTYVYIAAKQINRLCRECGRLKTQKRRLKLKGVQ